MMGAATGKALVQAQRGLRLSLWLTTAQIETGWVCERSFNKLFEVWGYFLSVFIIPALGITRMKNSVYFKLFPLKDQWCFYFPAHCVHHIHMPGLRHSPNHPPLPPQHEVCVRASLLSFTSPPSLIFGRLGKEWAKTLPWNGNTCIRKQIQEVKVSAPHKTSPPLWNASFVKEPTQDFRQCSVNGCLAIFAKRSGWGWNSLFTAFQLGTYMSGPGSTGWHTKSCIQVLLPFLLGMLPPDCYWFGSSQNVDMWGFYWVWSCQYEIASQFSRFCAQSFSRSVFLTHTFQGP